MEVDFLEVAEALAPRRGLLVDYDREARTGLNRGGVSRSDYEAAIFHNMLNRTAHMFRERKFLHPDERGKSSETWPGGVRVVSISSNLEINNSSQLEFATFRDGCSLLRPTEKFSWRRWTERRLKELKAGLAQQPHILSFPEFAYPAPPRTDGGGWTIEEINEAVRQRANFDAKAIEMLEAHVASTGQSPFVFLGSYHCLMTLYNVGVIYPWGSTANGEMLGKVTKTRRNYDGVTGRSEQGDREVVEGPVLYRKRFPARSLGEQTRVPDGVEFNIFERPFGKIGLLICSDVLDLNQFLRLVRESVNFHQGFEFILIPCYSPRGEGTFETMCKELSYMTGTAVVVTSAADESLEDKRGMAPTEIYLCGKQVTDYRKWKIPYLKNVVTTTRSFTAGESKGRLYELNMNEFRRARNSHLRRLLNGEVATRIESWPL